MTRSLTSDVVVVGAGTAGAHLAACLARGGVRTTVVERRESGLAGAQWLNGVPPWMFDAAGLERPVGEELIAADETVHMVGPGATTRITLSACPTLAVDMRLLGARLIRRALEAPNTRVLWGASVEDVRLDRSGRPVAVVVRGPGRAARTLRAPLFVDATGLRAAVRSRVPALAMRCPTPAPEHLCTAVQEVRDVADRVGALAFLQRHRLAPGERLNHVAVRGGFSLLQLGLTADLQTVDILTGASASMTGTSGGSILRSFLAENRWVGARRFGGRRAIPLRRPYTHLVAPGLALLGDAACQVFSSHASGIGVGLVAARLLAEAVCGAASAGADLGSVEVLGTYATTFHRRWGGLLAGADLSRRFTQGLERHHSQRLLGSGLLNDAMLRAAVDQRPVKVRPRDLPRLLLGALRAPEVVARMAPVFARLPWIDRLARRYPDATDLPSLDRHEARMARLMGDT